MIQRLQDAYEGQITFSKQKDKSMIIPFQGCIPAIHVILVENRKYNRDKGENDNFFENKFLIMSSFANQMLCTFNS